MMMKSILTAAIVGIALMAAPLATQPAQAQQTKAEKSTKAKKPLTPGQKAARERQKKCRAEWKASKAAGKVQKGMTWPKYWSACNKKAEGRVDRIDHTASGQSAPISITPISPYC